MSALRILALAVFLSASWTWCIGMYLPALLVRDYGIWAFFIFAIPNCLGAAAMAWLIPNAQASRDFVQKHHTACEWFSIVTILFHVFFIVSMLPPRMPIETMVGLFSVLFVIFYFALWIRRIPTIGLLFAFGVTIFSILTAYHLYTVRPAAIPFLPPPVRPSIDLLPLAVLCAFGLGLCPYLDLTFHQVRRSTSNSGGKLAFGIGFGFFFFLTLLFTLAYSHWALTSYWPYALTYSIMTYFLAQSVLKLILHSPFVVWRSRNILITAIGTAIIIFVFGSAVRPLDFTYNGLSFFEFFYRLFMSFYGLFFPAYVWICIFNKKSPLIWLTAVLIAAPMFWMGFIERQMLWLIPGVAVPLLAPLTKLVVPARVALENQQ